MDQILHNEPPYYLRTNKKVTFNFGNPIDLRQAVAKLREANVKPKEARKKITDLIQKELYALKTETEELHAKFTSSWPGVCYFLGPSCQHEITRKQDGKEIYLKRLDFFVF